MSDQRNIDVEQSADGSALVSGDHNHIDQSRPINIYLPEKQPTPNRTDRNEKILPSAVWAEVQDRLNQSRRLGGAKQNPTQSNPIVGFYCVVLDSIGYAV